MLRDYFKNFPAQASGIGIGMLCVGSQPGHYWAGAGWIVAGFICGAVRALREENHG